MKPAALLVRTLCCQSCCKPGCVFPCHVYCTWHLTVPDASKAHALLVKWVCCHLKSPLRQADDGLQRGSSMAICKRALGHLQAAAGSRECRAAVDSACGTAAQAVDRCLLRSNACSTSVEALAMWQATRGPLTHLVQLQPSGCVLKASGLAQPLIEGQEAALPAPKVVLARRSARCTAAKWPASQLHAVGSGHACTTWTVLSDPQGG